MLVEILDDDARLGHDAVARRILQHGELADRPERAQRGALGLVLPVHELARERRAVLVQRDQHLVAERGQRMEVQCERHAVSRLHDDLEPAVYHPPPVERHRLRLHQVGEARVLHDPGEAAVARGARLVDDIGKHHRLVLLHLHAARERGPLAHLHVVGNAFAKLERAVLAPDFSGLLCHGAVTGKVLLRQRHDKSVDVEHAVLQVLVSRRTGERRIDSAGKKFCRPYPACAFSSAARSSFLIVIIACMVRFAFSGSGSVMKLPITAGAICHESPYLSLSQPHWPSCPPSAVSAFQYLSISAWSRHVTRNDTASVNGIGWPPLSAMNSWSCSVKIMVSTVPLGSGPASP